MTDLEHLITQLNPNVVPQVVLQMLNTNYEQHIDHVIGNNNITKTIGTSYLLLDCLVTTVDPTFGNHFKYYKNNILVTAKITIEELNRMVLPIGKYPCDMFTTIVTNYFKRVYHFDSNFAVDSIKQIVTNSGINADITISIDSTEN